MSGAAVTGNATFGFYGKLPARGDFVRAVLPRDFITAWDCWLQAALPATLEAIGDAWQHAAAWQFHLSPGICGMQPVSGVLLPSRDAVGRRFPLTVAAPGSDADCLAKVETLARSAIEESWAPDALLAAIKDVSPAPGPSVPAGMALWHLSSGRDRALLLPGLPDSATLTSMLQEDVDAG